MEFSINRHRIAPQPKIQIRLIDLITIFYMSFCVLELSAGSYKYICLALMAVWAVVAAFENKKAFTAALNDPAILILMAFSVLYFVYAAFTAGFVLGLKHVFTLVIAESPYLLFLFYKEGENRRRAPLIILFAVFAVMLFLCRNILNLIADDPNAARMLAADTNIYQDYITGGGYQTAYAVAVLTPVLLKTFSDRKYKLFTVVLIGIFFYTLLKCGYTIAILIFVAELLFLFYWKSEDAINTKVIKVLLFLGIVLLMILFKNLLGQFFINVVSPLFEGSFTERRMREFGELLIGNYDDQNGAVSRFELYGMSLGTFFENPFIGVSYKTLFSSSLEINHEGERLLGMHSSLLDGLARMGLLYIPYITFFIKALSRINKEVSKSYWVIAAVFFVLKLINIADAFVLSFAAYFAIPLLLDHQSRKKGADGEIERSV